MDLRTRKIIDRYFSAFGLISIGLMAAALVVILGPFAVRGIKAFVFRGTIEYRLMTAERFGRGRGLELEAEIAEVEQTRRPVYRMLESFKKDLEEMGFAERRKYSGPL